MDSVTFGRCFKVLWSYCWRATALAIFLFIFIIFIYLLGVRVTGFSFFIGALNRSSIGSCLLFDIARELFILPVSLYAFFKVIQKVAFSDFQLISKDNQAKPWWRSSIFYFWWHWRWRTFLLLLPIDMIFYWLEFEFYPPQGNFQDERGELFYTTFPLLLQVVLLLGRVFISIWVLRRLLLKKEYGVQLVDYVRPPLPEVRFWRCFKLSWAHYWRFTLFQLIFFGLLAGGGPAAYHLLGKLALPAKDNTGFFLLGLFSFSFLISFILISVYTFFRVVRVVEFSDFKLAIAGNQGQSWWRSPTFYFWWHWRWRSLLIYLFIFFPLLLFFIMVDAMGQDPQFLESKWSSESDGLYLLLMPWEVVIRLIINALVLRRLLSNKPRDFGGRLVLLQPASSHTPLPERD